MPKVGFHTGCAVHCANPLLWKKTSNAHDLSIFPFFSVFFQVICSMSNAVNDCFKCKNDFKIHSLSCISKKQPQTLASCEASNFWLVTKRGQKWQMPLCLFKKVVVKHRACQQLIHDLVPSLFSNQWTTLGPQPSALAASYRIGMSWSWGLFKWKLRIKLGVYLNH